MVKSTGVRKPPGYYVCTTGERKRLHVAVWEAYWGCEVPAGCVIHHLDWNKSHNAIKNLICLTHREHEAVHNPTPGRAGGREWGYELIKTRVDGLPYMDGMVDEIIDEIVVDEIKNED